MWPAPPLVWGLKEGSPYTLFPEFTANTAAVKTAPEMQVRVPGEQRRQGRAQHSGTGRGRPLRVQRGAEAQRFSDGARRGLVGRQRPTVLTDQSGGG